MRGNVYLLAVNCLIFYMTQTAEGQAAAPAAAPAAPAAPAPAAAAAPAATDGFCPTMTLRALRMNCVTMDGATAKPVSCSQAPVGSTITVVWRKHSLKNLNSGLEIECVSPGVWKIKAKTIVGKADYTVVPGVGAYKVHKEKKSWGDAEAICIKEGGHLAVVDTDDESKEMKKMIATIGKVDGSLNAMHTGIYDKDVEGMFQTILGAPFKTAPTFLPWAKGKPSAKLGEDCGGILLTTFELSNNRCSERLPFICELFQS